MQKISVVFSDGGIGDCCSRLVVINYIVNHHPEITTYLYVPDYFKEFAQRCLPASKVKIYSFTEIRTNPLLHDKTLPTYSFDKFNTRFNNLACHMVDHAFFFMNFQPTSMNDKNYVKINLKGVHVNYTLPERYAIMAVGYTSAVREWLPEHINQVCAYLVRKGIIPVFLGGSSSNNGAGHVIAPTFKETIDYSLGLNLIDKLSLVESAKVISKALVTVGLDSGLTHLSGCVDIPIVSGYTTVDPLHRMPIRNGILGWKCYPVVLSKEELSCIGCQSNRPFLFGHDFKTCYTGTLNCTKMLTADKYIEQIEKALKSE